MKIRQNNYDTHTAFVRIRSYYEHIFRMKFLNKEFFEGKRFSFLVSAAF